MRRTRTILGVVLLTLGLSLSLTTVANAKAGGCSTAMPDSSTGRVSCSNVGPSDKFRAWAKCDKPNWPDPTVTGYWEYSAGRNSIAQCPVGQRLYNLQAQTSSWG